MFANYLWLHLGNILSNNINICIRSRFFLSVNICGINLAENFRTFRILFKMKCICVSDMPTALAITLKVSLLSLLVIVLTFEIFASPVTCHMSPRFCCIFDGLFASQNFFSPTIYLIRYLIRPINLPNSVKFYISEWPNFVRTFLKAVISSMFSIRFPTIFSTVVNDWLYWVLNLLTSKLSGAKDTCLYFWKDIQ